MQIGVFSLYKKCFLLLYTLFTFLSWGYNVPMITHRRTLLLGIFIILIPFLGFPSAWKTFMILVSGATLIGFSVNITIPKKIPKRVVRRKENVNSVFRESIITTPGSSKKEKTTEKNWDSPLATPDKETIDEL